VRRNPFYHCCRCSGWPVVGVADGVVIFSVVDKFRSEDVFAANIFTIQVLLFIEHGKVIALANIECEIHVPCKDSCQFHDQVIGKAGFVGIKKQGVVDFNAGIPDAKLGSAVDCADGKFISVTADFQGAEFVDRVSIG